MQFPISDTISVWIYAFFFLFYSLEANHGKVFVSHALGYLTASQNGLSPNELLDVLSCDEDVLEDVFQYHVPPIRRLPVLLWTRLRLDLGKIQENRYISAECFKNS